MIDPKEFPNRTVDVATDYETILAFAKVIHFLEVLPHMNDEKGERILSYEEITVFRRIYEPKFDKILHELVRRYNLKIERFNRYAETPAEEGSVHSPAKRTSITIRFNPS